jgi:hypothetical protein
MSASNIVHGARAKVLINNKLIGFFSNVSFGLTYEAQPAYVLGKFAPASIDYVAQDVVQITASGWKVAGAGWHDGAGLPKLQDLLTADYMDFLVMDRVSNAQLAHIKNVRATSASGGFSNRQLSESTFTFMGIYISDDSASGGNEEDATANLGTEIGGS